jgi:SOS-response transcriptional repressor LexA
MTSPLTLTQRRSAAARKAARIRAAIRGDRLAPRQQQLFNFIASAIADTGKAPRLIDMCAHLGIASNGAVINMLARLRELGRIEIGTGCSRNIVILSLPLHEAA